MLYFSKLWGGNRKDTNQRDSPLACLARAGDLETEGTCASQEPRLEMVLGLAGCWRIFD